MSTKSKSRTTTERKPSEKPLVARPLPTQQPPTHPGEMLLEEFLKPLSVSQSSFAVRLGVSFPRLNEIIRGKRAVTPDTALRLARVTGMSAERAIEAMYRVAKEVRIFPLLTNNAELSPLVMPVIENLRNNGRRASVETVPYEFQRGGNQMLRIV